MRRHGFVVAVIAVLVCMPARVSAWNNVGHMTVAKLAYEQLAANQPAKLNALLAVLKKHPHYDLFLTANRPDGVAENEWVFLRAAMWPDWVKKNEAKDNDGIVIGTYNSPDDHFINKAFVLPGSEEVFAGADLNPVPNKNILAALNQKMATLKTAANNGGGEKQQAIALCWLLHLLGDVHQPLHCTTLLSKQFADKNPHTHKFTGDGGGNEFGVTIDGQPSRLHTFWDDLLGSPPEGFHDTPNNMKKTYELVQKAAEILHDPQYGRDKLQELNDHKEFTDWIDESFDLGKTVAYRNGDQQALKIPFEGAVPADAPPTPDNYNQEATKVARRRVALAGYRLQDKLGETLPQ